MPVHSRAHAPDRSIAVVRQLAEREPQHQRLTRVDHPWPDVDDLAFAVEQLDPAKAGVKILGELQHQLARRRIERGASRWVGAQQVGVGAGRGGQQQRQQRHREQREQ